MSFSNQNMSNNGVELGEGSSSGKGSPFSSLSLENGIQSSQHTPQLSRTISSLEMGIPAAHHEMQMRSPNSAAERLVLPQMTHLCAPSRRYVRSNQPRIRWTTPLHRRFVDTVDMLGGQAIAKPKDITEMMNVKGLTIAHIKSHLQLYRTMKNEERKKKQATEAREARPEVNQGNAPSSPDNSYVPEIEVPVQQYSYSSTQPREDEKPIKPKSYIIFTDIIGGYNTDNTREENDGIDADMREVGPTEADGSNSDVNDVNLELTLG